MNARARRIVDGLVIAGLSVLVAIGGGFHPAINLAVALAGGLTAAVILFRA